MPEELICPHCGEIQRMHEAEDTECFNVLTECESCGKIFEYSCMLTRIYRTTTVEDL